MTTVQLPLTDDDVRRLDAIAARLGVSVERTLQRLIVRAIAAAKPATDDAKLATPHFNDDEYASVRDRHPWIGSTDALGSANNDLIDRDLTTAYGDDIRRER